MIRACVDRNKVGEYHSRYIKNRSNYTRMNNTQKHKESNRWLSRHNATSLHGAIPCVSVDVFFAAVVRFDEGIGARTFYVLVNNSQYYTIYK